MTVAIRIIGACLVLLGAANIVALFVIDLADLISPPLVIVRYTLMIAAGMGFVLLRRWGLWVYLTSLSINWIALYVVYDGKSVGPVWLSLPIPVVIAALCYWAWGRLKPGFSDKAPHNG